MEGNSLVNPLNVWVKGNYSPTNAMECKGITRLLVGNYQGIDLHDIREVLEVND